MREFLIRHKVAVIRIAMYLHALPYLAVAWGLGWVIGWVFWSSIGIPSSLGGWLCSGGVAALMLRDWWKEWRQARRYKAAAAAYHRGLSLGQRLRDLETRRELTH